MRRSGWRGPPPGKGLTPVVCFLASSKGTLKEAARLGEERTSRRGTRASPKNLGAESTGGQQGKGSRNRIGDGSSCWKFPAQFPDLGGKRPRLSLDAAGRMLGALGLGCLPCSDNVGTSGGSVHFLAQKKAPGKLLWGAGSCQLLGWTFCASCTQNKNGERNGLGGFSGAEESRISKLLLFPSPPLQEGWRARTLLPRGGDRLPLPVSFHFLCRRSRK